MLLDTTITTTTHIKTQIISPMLQRSASGGKTSFVDLVPEGNTTQKALRIRRNSFLLCPSLLSFFKEGKMLSQIAQQGEKKSS